MYNTIEPAHIARLPLQLQATSRSDGNSCKHELAKDTRQHRLYISPLLKFAVMAMCRLQFENAGADVVTTTTSKTMKLHCTTELFGMMQQLLKCA
jgi:hypothetical protein